MQTNASRTGGVLPIATCWPLVIATFAVGTDAYVVAGFLPQMAHDLHISAQTAGQSISAFTLTYAVSSPIAAAITMKWNRRSLLVGALVLLAAANFLSGISTTFAMLVATRVVAGIAASVVTPTAGVIAAATVDDKSRGRALGLVIAGLTLATAIGVPAGTVLSDVSGWRPCLMAVAVLCLLSALVTRSFCPRVDGTRDISLKTRFAPLANRQVLAVVLLTTLGMATAYLAYTYLGTITGITGTDLTIVLAGYGVGAVVGSLLGGVATDRFGSTKPLLIAYLVMGPAVAACVLVGNVALTTVAALVWGAAAWTQTPPQQQRLLRLESASPTMAIGLNASALYLGIAIGTTTGGALLDAGSSTIAGAVIALALLSLGGNCLVALILRHHR